MDSSLIIEVDADTLTFVYDKKLEPLFALGEARIDRASYVEPIPGTTQWTADMGPVGGPVLGPFASRDDALVAERAWLKEYRGI